MTFGPEVARGEIHRGWHANLSMTLDRHCSTERQRLAHALTLPPFDRCLIPRRPMLPVLLRTHATRV